MTPSQKPQSTNRNDTKTLLSTLKWTTTIGAVSLTLAGWGLLSGAEAINTAQAAQNSPAEFAGDAPAASMLLSASATGLANQDVSNRTIASASIAAAKAALATPTRAAPTATLAPAGSIATATSAPMVTSAPTETSAPTPAPAPTATSTPATLFKLNVTQWVTTNAGDPVAVVQDNQGTLWYVWGPDVPRIEQGLDPQYQPQPVNGTGRSRRS